NPSDLVQEATRQRIYQYALKHSNRFWLNASQGINFVKQGGYAFHIASTVGQNFETDEHNLNPSDLVQEATRQRIYQYALKNSNRFWLNASQGINFVKQGGYAFHIASTVGGTVPDSQKDTKDAEISSDSSAVRLVISERMQTKWEKMVSKKVTIILISVAALILFATICGILVGVLLAQNSNSQGK
ncbi:hypothetical protein HUJ05_000916, partial [Dendroctonus ponderosae]